MTKQRLDRARTIISEYNLDVMLFTDMKNVRYLTGFTGSDGAFMLTADDACFMTDSRYTTQASSQVGCSVIEYGQKVPGIVEQIRKQASKGRVGLESQVVTLDFHREIEQACGKSITLVPLADSTRLRGIKDESEIDLIEKSAVISASSLESIVDVIKPGASEADVALALEIASRRNGSEVKAFDFIVASGERGALPHGVASNKQIEADELITIDFGSCYEGYFSDETVNFALGDIPSKMSEIHDIVLKAHDRAIAAVTPGKSLREIDRVARDFIAAKGYDKNFGHGLGHGVGLDVHEWPRVSPLSDAEAEPGMVFTIEPGIYIPGVGGVRIEDIVVVTETGCRCLTQLPKTLRLI
ncbi:MAG: integrase [Desulfuromonas sp.]|nr:MAG: integrase [Desulfuromonas sp.]